MRFNPLGGSYQGNEAFHYVEFSCEIEHEIECNLAKNFLRNAKEIPKLDKA